MAIVDFQSEEFSDSFDRVVTALSLCGSAGRAINSYLLHQLEKALHGALYQATLAQCALCHVCHVPWRKVCRTKSFAGRLECADFQSREVAGVQN